MNREQRRRLNQLAPEQQAWLDNQETFEYLMPNYYGQGQVDWLAQMEAMYPARPQAKRKTFKQDWKHPKSLMDPDMPIRRDQPRQNSGNTGAANGPASGGQAYYQQPVVSWPLPPQHQNQNTWPATVYDALYRHQGQPRVQVQPSPYLQSPAGPQIQLLANGGQPTLYWTNHNPGISPVQNQDQQNHLAEQARLRNFQQTYMGNNPRYYKDVPPMFAPTPPPGPWQPGLMTPPGKDQRAEEAARKFHQGYDELMKKRFGPKHPNFDPDSQEAMTRRREEIWDFTNNKLEPLANEFTKWIKSGEIFPVRLSEQIYKELGKHRQIKDLKLMIEDTVEEFKKLNTWQVGFSGLLGAAMAGIIIIAGTPVAATVVLGTMLTAGVGAAAISVMAQIGESKMIKLGIPPKTANDIRVLGEIITGLGKSKVN